MNELFNLLPDSMSRQEKEKVCWDVRARIINWSPRGEYRAFVNNFCAIPPEPGKPTLTTCPRCGVVLGVDFACPPKQDDMLTCVVCKKNFLKYHVGFRADGSPICGDCASPKQEAEELHDILFGLLCSQDEHMRWCAKTDTTGEERHTRWDVMMAEIRGRIVEAIVSILDSRRHHEDAKQAIREWAK